MSLFLRIFGKWFGSRINCETRRSKLPESTVIAGFMHINSCHLDPPVASLYEYAFSLKVPVLRFLFSFARQTRRSFLSATFVSATKCARFRDASRDKVIASCAHCALQYRSKARINKPLLYIVLLRTLPVFNIQPLCRTKRTRSTVISREMTRPLEARCAYV